jgi:hypothetical protein
MRSKQDSLMLRTNLETAYGFPAEWMVDETRNPEIVSVWQGNPV